jgi:hypothetical protein
MTLPEAIAIVRSACEKVLEADRLATQGPIQRNGSHLYGPHPARKLLAQFHFDGDGTDRPDANAIILSRNLIPAMARLLLATLPVGDFRCSKREPSGPLGCPQCGMALFTVENTGGVLNDDQFDSVRAGDYYCVTYRGTESKSGHKYWWKRELYLPSPTPCHSCAAILAAAEELSK